MTYDFLHRDENIKLELKYLGPIPLARVTILNKINYDINLTVSTKP